MRYAATAMIAINSLLVLAAWAIGWDWPKSWVYGWPEQKPITAAMFIAGCAMVHLLDARKWRLAASVAMLIVLVVLGAIPATVGTRPSGLTGGLPSIGTIILLLAIAWLGLMESMTRHRNDPTRTTVSTALFLGGLISVVGYIVNMPAFYWYVPGITTGMAIHTSISFLVLAFVIQPEPRYPEPTKTLESVGGTAGRPVCADSTYRALDTVDTRIVAAVKDHEDRLHSDVAMETHKPQRKQV